VRFKIVREEYVGEHTREGITVPVTKTREVRMPVLPRNWDSVALRVVVGLVGVLTLASIVWSTWSIGSLLHGGPGYLAAGVFDLAWAVSLALEYLGRFDAEKRKFSTRLGWVLLLATMGLIFWHGMTLHSVGMAVGGAAVSAFAKILWLGVMKHVHRELSPEDSQWVAAQISAANAKMAVADARRRASHIEQRAALELLAMERETHSMRAAMGLPAQDTDAEPLPVADAPEAVATAPQAPALPAGITPEALAAALALVQGAQAGPGASAPEHPAGHPEHQAYDDAEAEEIPAALEPPTLATLPKADAIRIVLQRRPELAPSQVAELLAGYGVNTSADYVRQVRNRDAEAAREDQDQDGAAVVQLHKNA
jgi:hypothetical protein